MIMKDAGDPPDGFVQLVGGMCRIAQYEPGFCGSLPVPRQRMDEHPRLQRTCHLVSVKLCPDMGVICHGRA
jgi:hypothetical protein